MITASPSIRALIPRVSDTAHLHCGARSTLAQRNLGGSRYRWHTGVGVWVVVVVVGWRQWGTWLYKKKKKKKKTVGDTRNGGGWAEGGGDKMRIERCKEEKD